MDIFSEPGVIKASQAMLPVTFGSGASPTDLPAQMVDTADGSNTRAYIMAGDKILESTDGITWNLFLTNGNGVNVGMGIWAGYVIYASADQLGRAPVGVGASKDDSFQALDNEFEYHPMISQGGSFKIGDGRYIASLDETFNFTLQAMKLPEGYRIRTFAEFFTKLFMGTRYGASTGAVLVSDSTIFDWDGIVLSSGVALPTTPYPAKLRATNALLASVAGLFAFPDRMGEIQEFDGARFSSFRKVFPIGLNGGSLIVQPGAVAEYQESALFAGDADGYPGVYQIKEGAICQALVPSVSVPGDATAAINITMVKSSFNSRVFIGYFSGADFTYHIEGSDSANKQNGAILRTLWHRLTHIRGVSPDRLKRWIGVKLNLKPLAAGCSVTVGYRTSRNAAFVDSGYVITSANQNKPVLFRAQPRARELQYLFTYTINGNNTPELISYDPLFEILSTLHE